MRWWWPSLLVALAFSPAIARADEVSEAKAFFKAGAAAYAAGDYLAAIQALDAAYRATPLPAIAFSLAQAERRQYFVSHEPQHLTRAIELYRVYLDKVPSGGRRADAADALAQLEPLAVGLSTQPAADAAATSTPPVVAKTRLMVTSEAPGATVSLDGAPPVPSPLIAEVTAGTHTVSVGATGYSTSERRVVAVAGELVPLEVELKERLAVVLVEPSIEVDLYVDGAYMGRVTRGARVELPGGSHQFAFAKKGRRLESMMLTLERGSTRRLPVELHWTAQRMTAVSLFIVSGVTFVGGLLTAAGAAGAEYEAEQILNQREEESLSPSELQEYEDAIELRNRLRVGAAASLAISAGSLVTGIILHELDDPNVRDIFPRSRVDSPKPAVRVEAGILPSPGGFDVTARVTF
ncbi:MAG TPA: PEGA domain-containing protein [Polyangiaceae bacterium]|nr:PEGA domain-containing protein [Polyangiaceae bacterium]